MSQALIDKDTGQAFPAGGVSALRSARVSMVGLPASGVDPVSGDLESNTPTQEFEPIPGREFYLELIGTGSVTVTIGYLCHDGSTYAPNVGVAPDGTTFVKDKIVYDGATRNGVRVPLRVDQAGLSVKALPDTVTGDVSFAFMQ